MLLRRLWIVLALLLVPAVAMPTVAYADDHRAGVSGGGGGGTGASALKGIHFGFDWKCPRVPSHDLALILADFSVQFGEHGEDDIKQVAYMAGGRWFFAQPTDKKKLFIQGTAGVVHTNAGVHEGTKFAGAIGAGFEYLFKDQSSQPSAGGIGIRVQTDYFIRDDSDFWRGTVEIVYRFKR